MAKETTSVILARIEERQIAMQETQKQQLEEAKKTNGRVTKLENWQHKIIGGIIVIAALIGIVEAIIH